MLLFGTFTLGHERSGAGQTPVPLVVSAPGATVPQPVRTAGDGDETRTASRPPTPHHSGRHPRPEELVRLPVQIQQQVARTVLTSAPLLRPAEIFALPLQIQDQVRQAYQAATPDEPYPGGARLRARP